MFEMTWLKNFFSRRLDMRDDKVNSKKFAVHNEFWRAAYLSICLLLPVSKKKSMCVVKASTDFDIYFAIFNMFSFFDSFWVPKGPLSLK